MENKLSLKFWEENPAKRPLWTAAYLLGMTDLIPLSKTHDEALSKFLFNRHTQYLPDNSATVLDALAHGKGRDEPVSFWVPHDCMSILIEAPLVFSTFSLLYRGSSTV
jgi:hypothetical protein